MVPHLLATTLLCMTALPAAGQPATDALENGRQVYEFYCYQCHAYAGDARTLASTWLDPQPRNFTAADPRQLTRTRMISAVTGGRPETAMTGFSSVLTGDEIEAVVDYIRAHFMQGQTPSLIYHSAENGWPDHDRYRDAFPFASGETALDTPWEQLTPAQQRGRRLFMQSCISCHDRARVLDEGPIWELRALSWPRRHYTHTAPVDATSGASPYALHDRPPVRENMTAQEQRGEQLYQDNCAFCHAADGTARNWIGSFLEPRPRNLTGQSITAMGSEWLKAVIMEGIEGTSMPAWKHVLDEAQITAIIDYVRHVLGVPGDIGSN